MVKVNSNSPLTHRVRSSGINNVYLAGSVVDAAGVVAVVVDLSNSGDLDLRFLTFSLSLSSDLVSEQPPYSFP